MDKIRGCRLRFSETGEGWLKLDEAGRGKKGMEKVRGCYVILG
jgi:hypothetical protein